ncbi:MAG: aminopeptidase, partial [Gammaproteobacteria bacterium]
MKHKVALLSSALLFVSSIAAFAGEGDYDATADKLVNESLNVQPGEIVLINGHPMEMELLEAVQVAVSKAGAEPVVLMNLPAATKRSLMETPIEYLKQVPTGQIKLIEMADAQIDLFADAQPDRLADVPEERLAANRQAGAPVFDALVKADIRYVGLGQTGGIPTEAYAASQTANYSDMTDMFWSAVGVSPAALASVGKKVAVMLDPGASARLTADNGTNLAFKLDKGAARINAGRTADVADVSGAAQVWLPAGETYTCVDTSSATGTLVVDQMTFRGMPVENLKMTFKDGRMIELTADSNADMLKEYFAASTPNTRDLSVVDVGLNPASQPIDGSKYNSWEMGGMVTLSMGNNVWAGGENDSVGGLAVHVPGATLEVAGTTIVEKGELIAGL